MGNCELLYFLLLPSCNVCAIICSFKHSTMHFDDVFFATAYGEVAVEIVDHLYNRR